MDIAQSRRPGFNPQCFKRSKDREQRRGRDKRRREGRKEERKEKGRKGHERKQREKGRKRRSGKKSRKYLFHILQNLIYKEIFLLKLISRFVEGEINV